MGRLLLQERRLGDERRAAIDNVELRASTSPIPVISDITPGSAPSGTYLVPDRNQSRVTITGSGFGATKGKVAFYYQERRAADHRHRAVVEQHLDRL